MATASARCTICHAVLAELGAEVAGGRVVGLSTLEVHVLGAGGRVVHRFSFFLRSIA